MIRPEGSGMFDSLQIAIIGVDGSGKSGCFKGISGKLSGRKSGGIGDEVFICENGKFSRPNIKYAKIRRLLGRRSKNIKNRTLYKILKFTELILRVKLHTEIEKQYKPEIILTDGSPLINTIGWGNFYHPDIFTETQCKDVLKYMTGTRIPLAQKKFYLKHLPEILVVNLFRVKFQKPDIVFFLNVSPEVAMSRIGKRDKKKQVHETKIFLSKLQEAYKLICRILSKDTKIYTIDTDGKTLKQVVDIVAEKI